MFAIFFNGYELHNPTVFTGTEFLLNLFCSLNRQILVFFVFLLLILSIFMITCENMIFCVFFLISIFLISVCMFVILNAIFLAFLFLIIYVGAVAVLFLFIVLMVNFYQIETIKIKFFDFFFLLILTLFYGLILIGINFEMLLKCSAPKVYIWLVDHGFSGNLIYTYKGKIVSLLVFSTETAQVIEEFNIFSIVQYLGILFNCYFFIIFILCGFLLLVAIVGIVLLSSSIENNLVLNHKQIQANQIFKMYSQRITTIDLVR